MISLKTVVSQKHNVLLLQVSCYCVPDKIPRKCVCDVHVFLRMCAFMCVCIYVCICVMCVNLHVQCVHLPSTASMVSPGITAPFRKPGLIAATCHAPVVKVCVCVCVCVCVYLSVFFFLR